MINFVLSQIFGGIALILICISYFTNKKKFLILNIALTWVFSLQNDSIISLVVSVEQLSITRIS